MKDKKRNLIIKSRIDDEYKIFSVRINKRITDELDNVSAKTNISRNRLIEIFLEYGLENCVIEESKEN